MSLLKKRKRVVGMRSLVTAVEALNHAVYLIFLVMPMDEPTVQSGRIGAIREELDRADAALGLRKDA